MKNVKSLKEGFTLIEILIVVFAVAILVAATQFFLINARVKTRDISRVSEIKQVQNGLELYFHNKNRYPIAESITLGGDHYNTLCDTAAGFQNGEAGCTVFYVKELSAAPTPPEGNSYVYSSPDGKAYAITFSLEKTAGPLMAGAHTATERGIN